MEPFREVEAWVESYFCFLVSYCAKPAFLAKEQSGRVRACQGQRFRQDGLNVVIDQ